MNGWVYGVGEWMGWVIMYVCEGMAGWMERWMSEWVDRWVDV